MIKISYNLPFAKRLHVSIVSRRKPPVNPIATILGDVSRVRKGSRLSRLIRHLLELVNIRKLFGVNITLAIAISTLIPSQSLTITTKADSNEIVIAEAPMSLPKEKLIRYPVETISVTQGFSFFHPGIDLDGITGDPIYPIMGGRVEAIDYSKFAYGNAIYIIHENGITSLYAHLSKIFVKADQEVNTSDIIGEMGATGHAFGDHLHLEIKKDGVPINPLVILPN